MKASFALSSLIVLLAASVTAQEYIVRMHRPLKAGQRYELSAVSSFSGEQYVSSGPGSFKKQTEDIMVDMESVVTVLAVHANGLPKKESHTIVKFLHGAKRVPLLPAGTEVIASLSGRQTVFEVGGRPANEAERKHLELVAALSSDGPTEDTLYGTWERKKPGDSWPVNSTMATRQMDEILAPMGLKTANFEGKTTFQKVTQDGGTNVFHLRINVKATANPVVKVPRASAQASVEGVFNTACPADITKSTREEESKLIILFNTFSPPDTNGVTKQLSTKATRSITAKFKLLEQDIPAPSKPSKPGR